MFLSSFLSFRIFCGDNDMTQIGRAESIDRALRIKSGNLRPLVGGQTTSRFLPILMLVAYRS